MKKLKSLGFAGIYLVIPIVLQLLMGVMLAVQIAIYGFISGRGNVDTEAIAESFESYQYNLILVALLNLILNVGMGLWYYFIRTRKQRSPVPYQTILSPKSLLCTLGMAISGQFVCNFVMIAFHFAAPKVYDDYIKLSEGLDIHVLPAAAMLFIVGIWSPLAEELVFRGMIFRTLRKGFSFFPAALISGVMFGVYHMNWVQGVYAGLLGILLAYVYEKTNSLLGAYLFHLMFNLSSYGISALQELKMIPDLLLGLIVLGLHVLSLVGIVCFIRWFSKLYPKAEIVEEKEVEPYEII